jgi:hypothetical protein
MKNSVSNVHISYCLAQIYKTLSLYMLELDGTVSYTIHSKKNYKKIKYIQIFLSKKYTISNLVSYK